MSQEKMTVTYLAQSESIVSLFIVHVLRNRIGLRLGQLDYGFRLSTEYVTDFSSHTSLSLSLFIVQQAGCNKTTLRCRSYSEHTNLCLAPMNAHTCVSCFSMYIVYY
jgi:hypothetical protein